jgi:hypothetical protein
MTDNTHKMPKIREAIIKACAENPSELPEEIPAEVIADSVELTTESIARVMNNQGMPPLSKALGMTPEQLESVLKWCKVSVLVHTKANLFVSLVDNVNEGWTNAQLVYAGYWIGLYEAGMMR